MMRQLVQDLRGLKIRVKETLTILRERINDRVKPPTLENLVTSIVLNTANLELDREEEVHLAGLKGMCGSVKLTGNSLPTFRYTLFDKELMEFIEVRVEISRPNRMEWISRISSQEGCPETETKDKYKDPFLRLAAHLYLYFPLTRDPKKKGMAHAVA